MAKSKTNISKADAADNAADYAWLMRVFSLIPDSVYGRVKGKTESKALRQVNTNSKTIKKKKNSKKKAKGKKLTDMPEKMQELQQRLRDKIATLRGERKADDSELVAKRESRKRNREENKDKKSIANHRKKNKSEKKAPKVEENPSESEHAEDDPSKSVEDLEVSRLEGFDAAERVETSKSKKRPRTKGSRLKDLEKQLGDALAVRETSTKVDDDEKMKEQALKKALLRAKGVTVKDDVSKLRKTIRKEKRKTEKSKEEWSQRVKSLEEEKMAKQKKREDNLKERRESKGKSKSKSKKSKSKSKGTSK